MANGYFRDHLAERVGADRGVRLHQDPLVGVERAGLVQDVVGQRRLADVVQRGAVLQHADVKFGVELAANAGTAAASSASTWQ